MDDETVESLVGAVGEVLESELAEFATNRSILNRTTLERVLERLGELGFLTASADRVNGLGLHADVRLASHIGRRWGSLAWAALPTFLSNRLGVPGEYVPTALAFPELSTWSDAHLDGTSVLGKLAFVLNGDSASRVLAVSPSGETILAIVAEMSDGFDEVEGFREAAHVTVGLEPDGSKAASDILSALRILKAAIATGLAAGAIDLGVRYAKERVQFGHPIGVYGEIRSIIARASMQQQAASALVCSTARAWDAGRCTQADAARALLNATEHSTVAIERMQHVHGGYGQMAEFEIGRYVRDIRVLGAFELPLPVLEDVIGDGLGLPRLAP